MEEGLVGGQGIVVVVVVQARQLVAQQENGTCVSRHLRRSCSVRHLNAQSPLLLALRNLTSSSHEGVVGWVQVGRSGPSMRRVTLGLTGRTALRLATLAELRTPAGRPADDDVDCPLVPLLAFINLYSLVTFFLGLLVNLACHAWWSELGVYGGTGQWWTCCGKQAR